ncbi:MAG TPA: TonB-dependent receptor [Flavipsychrobacter sp.]|nr:TonB-dependent receptor [Flavipsychrobacter sp.]
MTLLLTILCLFETTTAQSLSDTLSEVRIRQKKKQSGSQDLRIHDFTSGQKIVTLDSVLLQQYKMQTAAQLLAQQTPVFIKSYGFNGLATLNFRGASAAQSQVYWNGVPLQNAALGIADVSLLPVSFINSMQIVYGGSAALLGSGNVGGALVLETEKPVFDSLHKTGYEIGLGAGSFAQYQLAAKGSYSSERWFLAAHVLWQTAQNDFVYEKNGKESRNENSNLSGASAMVQAAYQHDHHNRFRVIGWYQHYDRQIPAALFESYSVKNRKDASLKLFADWNRNSSWSQQYFRTSFITDEMRYEDTMVRQHTINTSCQYYAEAGWKQRIAARHKALVFIPVHLSFLQRDSARIAMQSRYALAAAYNYTDLKDKLDLNLQARVERVNNVNVLLPGANASYQLLDWIKLRVNIQKTYRAPSLNELYFDPGGNKNLKPEKGWASDAGYTITLQPTSCFSIHHDIAAYYRLIDDWILWFGGAIWTPHNIAQVKSTGWEADWTFRYKLNKLELHLGFKGSYTRSLTMQSDMAGDGSIGKQIPYTPQWMGLINAGADYKRFYINYNHGYTGLRYFNTDETGALPSYQVANVQLGKEIDRKVWTWHASAMLNNIFNERYTVVASRPMPGRNFALSISLRKK